MSLMNDAPAPTWSGATRVRYGIVAVATLAAVLLYLERICLAMAGTYIREDLRLSMSQLGVALSVFFWAYAIGQVPTGWFSDRYGPRRMMVVYLVVWSIFGIVIAMATNFWMLVAARLALGLFQAGAYPTLAILVKRWVPVESRGTANSIVAFGGRFGGTAANLLTAFLIVWFVPLSAPTEIREADVLDPTALVRDILNPNPDGPAKAIRPLVSEHLTADFPPGAFDAIRAEAPPAVASGPVAGQPASASAAPWIPKPETVQVVLGAMNRFIETPSDIEAIPQDVPLSSDARAILDVTPRSRTDEQSRRLNRLLLERAYPGDFVQLHVQGWRPTLLLFGFAGIAVGAIFWIFVRDWPWEHPGVNEEEIELIRGGNPAAQPGAANKAPPVPWGLLMASPNVWYSSVMQFGVNVGWTFIITLMPEYLAQQFNVPIEQRGLMTSMPLIGGCAGMLLGGWLTDRLTRQFGLRWGRGVFLGPSKLVGAALIFLCPFLGTAWGVTWALTVFAFTTDMGIPATWGFAQDTGGKHVGSVLGWGNMWGNIGAGLAPLIAVQIRENWSYGWDAVFFVNAGAFVLAAVFGSWIDCRIPLEPEPTTDETLEPEAA
ncbi:MFS transporter [Planctomyces sp. SH-PL14]|uniref:MFS transporter n=1 Tax=Planctomyces sp. SH-PL14 TaxID=1632864 RepID=UPI00078D53CB|nr:MFS transporter [Planctomyces sp. SH-PL14]AMV19373.1 putative sulfoacetate transporter SauU [Planctomyces sp. SH-PL14]